MEVVFIALAILVGYFLLKRSAARGQRFVRAYYFLEQIGMGEPVEDANQMASDLFTDPYQADLDRSIIISARSYAKAQYGGKQLPIIAEAHAKGFKDENTAGVTKEYYSLHWNSVVDELLSYVSKIIPSKEMASTNANLEKTASSISDQYDVSLLDKRWFLVPAGLLLLAILPFPYGFHILLRIIVSIASGVICYAYIRSNDQGWAATFFLVCILFNPIIPIHLSKGIWALLDVIVAVIFYLAWRASRTQDEDSR